MGPLGAERGQSTVEWIALVLLVSLLALAALALAGMSLPGAPLARAIAARMACAISLSDACATAPELVTEYGAEMAQLVSEHAPQIVYEPGESEVPVDFRECRAAACDTAASSGPVTTTNGGLPVVLFVHVVDCRAEAADAAEEAGYECSGGRAGNLYVQYWTYYADSSTLEALPGDTGYHADDWEGYQVRIGPGGAFARASSHHGYNYEQGAGNWGSDADIGPLNDVSEAVGLRPHGGWGPETGGFVVSSGSHAGNVRDDGVDHLRWTPAGALLLVPIEPVAEAESGTSFAVTPPWLKAVYHDPESETT